MKQMLLSVVFMNCILLSTTSYAGCNNFSQTDIFDTKQTDNFNNNDPITNSSNSSYYILPKDFSQNPETSILNAYEVYSDPKFQSRVAVGEELDKLIKSKDTIFALLLTDKSPGKWKCNATLARLVLPAVQITSDGSILVRFGSNIVRTNSEILRREKIVAGYDETGNTNRDNFLVFYGNSPQKTLPSITSKAAVQLHSVSDIDSSKEISSSYMLAYMRHVRHLRSQKFIYSPGYESFATEGNARVWQIVTNLSNCQQNPIFCDAQKYIASNEASAKNTFKLTDAIKGSSGYSFGIIQFDASANDMATNILCRITSCAIYGSLIRKPIRKYSVMEYSRAYNNFLPDTESYFQPVSSQQAMAEDTYSWLKSLHTEMQFAFAGTAWLNEHHAYLAYLTTIDLMNVQGPGGVKKSVRNYLASIGKNADYCNYKLWLLGRYPDQDKRISGLNLFLKNNSRSDKVLDC
jgi:hypothetical protein